MTLNLAGEVPAWTLAHRLKRAREHAQLSQQELADQIGVSRATVSNAETGRHVPIRPVVLSWAMVCGVDLEWLQGPPDQSGGMVRQGRRPRKPGRRTPLHGLAAAVPILAAAATTMT